MGTGVGPTLAQGSGVTGGGLAVGGSGVAGSVPEPQHLAHDWINLVDSVGGSNLTSVATTTTTKNGLTARTRTGSTAGQYLGNEGILFAQPFVLELTGKINTANAYYETLMDSRTPASPCVLYGNPTTNEYQFHAGVALATTGFPGAPDASWHHFWIEANGASSRIYVDGVLRASGNAGTNSLNKLTVLNTRDRLASLITPIIGRLRIYSALEADDVRLASTAARMTEWAIP